MPILDKKSYGQVRPEIPFAPQEPGSCYAVALVSSICCRLRSFVLSPDNVTQPGKNRAGRMRSFFPALLFGHFHDSTIQL